MKNKVRKNILSAAICLSVMAGAILPGLYSLAEPYQFGDVVEFGSYPQSHVRDAQKISELNALTLDWKSYGYYSGNETDGSSASGDWMRYADKEYKGEKYRAVVFDQYRPEVTDGDFEAESESLQHANGYDTGTVYWFLYSPIKWRVLDPASGLVLSELVLDSQPFNNVAEPDETANAVFDENGNPAGVWETSHLKTWLNSDFAQTAFSATEKNAITDGIGLLTLSDAVNTNYGFSNQKHNYGQSFFPEYRDGFYASDRARAADGTDYAICQGVYTHEGGALWTTCTNYTGSSAWENAAVRTVVYDGGMIGINPPNHTIMGVRPTMHLRTLDPDDLESLRDGRIFTIGRDNWNFRNTDVNFTSARWNPLYTLTSQFFPDKYYLSDNDMKKLILALSDSDLAALEENRVNKWSGSCSGMSITALLAFEDFSVTDPVRENATVLHEISKKGDDDAVESFINYFQMQWNTSNVFLHVYYGFEDILKELEIDTDNLRDDAENLKRYNAYVLQKMFDRGQVLKPYYIKICFRENSHAVVGYGSESGSFEVNGNRYDSKILIYDCNFVDKNSFSIYFNYGTGDFCTTGYATDTVVYFYPIFENNDLYTVDYNGNRSKSTIPTTPMFIYSGTSGNLQFDAGGSAIPIDHALTDAQHGIYAFDFPEDQPNAESSEKPFLFFTPSSDNAQTFLLHENDSSLLSCHAEHAYLSAQTDDARSVTFDPAGGIEAEGMTGTYDVRTTFDADYTCLPWTSVAVSGSNTDHVRLNRLENRGVVLETDGLANARIHLATREDKQSFRLTEPATSVLVSFTENDGRKEPLFLADQDHDGEYETPINAEPADESDDYASDGSTDADAQNHAKFPILVRVLLVVFLLLVVLIALLIVFLIKDRKKNAKNAGSENHTKRR